MASPMPQGTVPAFLDGGGEMGALIRATDWSANPIGPVEAWSPSLQAMVGFLLANRFPLLLWWGPHYIQLYNDAYRPVVGTKHPKSMGQPASECFAEIWHIIGPLIDAPFNGGPSAWADDMELEYYRYGVLEECHFTVAYSPVPDQQAPRGIGGVLATVHEITEQIVGERRVAALRDLGASAAEAKTAEEACAAAAETFAQYAKDVPFALIYLIEPGGGEARLAGAAGIEPGGEASPAAIMLDRGEPVRGWPLAEIVRSQAMLVVDDLAARFASAMPGPWSDPPGKAVLVPIRSGTMTHRLAGVLIAGISPRLRLDQLYSSFLDLAATQIASAVASARAYEEERRRAEALAEIDRAKTAFFSNASHELRTPLTLLLSPLEDLLLRAAGGCSVVADRNELELMHRNGRHLLKLVNTLLDFSRIEAGRFEAVYEPLGHTHLPAERIGAERTLATTEIGAEAFVEEALRWLDAEIGHAPAAEERAIGEAGSPAPLVLLADDNADMRLYVRRLLAPRYRVIAVADGAAALAAARRDRPDLILSDVMMPRLDGFELLASIRADPELREIPFILLSARAGEEARVVGISAGADDCMTKPFAARELLARVGANLDMARLRRQAAQAAEAHAAELKTLLETVPAAVWFTKDPKASRVWGNRYADRLLRLDGNANPSLSAPPNERPRHYKVFRDGAEADLASLPMQRAARGEEVRGDELEIRFDDGASLTLLAQAAPVRDGKGLVAGAICAGIDITIRKRAEAALRILNETLEERVALESERRRRAEAALAQAQKMEAIGQLTGGVAHDMNNLLMVIQGSLEIIERQLPAAENNGRRWRRPLQSALGGVERAAALTQRLLAFARRQSLSPKAVDPNRHVLGMSDLLRRSLGDAIVIDNVLADGAWHVFADPNQLENAVLNLAVNARDAMPEGGALTLQTANISLRDPVEPAGVEPCSGDYVTISVTDTGVGMSPEAVERAFEPFFTTKAIGQGTGLGLSQVYGFVKQSGGHIEIDSTLGLGTTVRIYLPRYDPRFAELEDNAAAPQIPTARLGESILVVEDDGEVRANSVASLRELGYRVIEAGNGADALRLLQSDPSLGLLLTDIGVPGGIDGRELADSARRVRPSLRVLFTTGCPRGQTGRDGPIGGNAMVLAKPFGFAALAAKVREALDS